MRTGALRFSCLLSLMLWAVVPRGSAQSRPTLKLQFSPEGQPTLSITGTVGVVYSIQYATNLSVTSHWTDRTLFQVRGTNDVWTDPDDPTQSQRFYLAVSVAAPADTNLVFIQPGTFTMGSATNEALRNWDETQHMVTISRGFWIGKYLVTQGDYLAVVGSNPSSFPGDLTRPVDNVSWFDAANYCALRTQHERTAGLIPTNYVYRLPTESEWEFAARAGTTTALYLGTGLHSGQANFEGPYKHDASVGEIYNPSGIYLGRTTPVGSHSANGWGLYDMAGNLWEWCEDWYGTYPAGSATDPQGADTGTNRLLRGASWANHGKDCRSSRRAYINPTLTLDDAGFRVVLSLVQ